MCFRTASGRADSDITSSVAVNEILPTLEEAEREVLRLNEQRSMQDVLYSGRLPDTTRWGEAGVMIEVHYGNCTSVRHLTLPQGVTWARR